MKNITLFIVFFHLNPLVFAQASPPLGSKTVVDTPAFFTWPSIQDWPPPAICNNGLFVLYSVRNMPAGSHSLIVQSLNGKEKIVLPQVRHAAFTADSRYAITLGPGDSLCLLKLPDTSKTYITNVTDFKLFTRSDEEWLAYTTHGPGKKLVLKNISSGAENSYSEVDSYEVTEDCNSMVLQSPPDANSDQSIRWVNLLTNNSREIWKGSNAGNVTLNKAGTQLAFLVHDSSTGIKTLWLYHSADEKARRSIRDDSSIPQNMELDALQGFSKDGSKLFVQLKQKPSASKKTLTAPVNIWSYTDAMLQSQQLLELDYSRPGYLAVFDIAAPSSLRRLQFEGESVSALTDSLLIATFRRGEPAERYWNKEALGTTYLVEVSTGKRTRTPVSWPEFSPQGKYVIGYGPDEDWGKDLYVYDIATGTLRNITQRLPIPEPGYDHKILSSPQRRNLVIAGWLPNESAVLIYDEYDIWKIDPAGMQPPLNLTNGRKEKWEYRLDEKEIVNGAIPSNSLTLVAFNKTKKCRFNRLSLSGTKGPEPIFTGDYYFQKFFTSNGPSRFLKARDANIYLVKRESATASPNISATTDFKNFTPLSKIQPEKSVNWLTTELISFNTQNGIPSQAILYKPENFDPSKKYPMIIQYYQKKSDELNWYRQPVVDNGGELDIPWFVSRGYLVLQPDIQYKLGEPGPSALKTVEGAAHFMAKRPYVDKHRIGIQGHSFGGYETNYIITHSNLFAAAMSGSGVCNVTSDFGNLWPGEYSRQEYWETRDGYIGTTPWQHPDLYVKNSPVFNIGEVTTPVLIVHNRNDKNVHFEQGLQFFTGLRRAGKRCWMLEYDNGGHGVSGDDYKDFLIRVTQFFDHYLKGAPAPKWMTRGIPAAMKGIDHGLELDTEIATPGPGLLISHREPVVNSNLFEQPNAWQINK
jgi:dipeptidyl aminopeptidase/acylaminoacyl peptidase